MGENIFNEEELNILATLVINDKSRTENQIFKQKPIDPEWEKYHTNLSGLLEKLKKMKD